MIKKTALALAALVAGVSVQAQDAAPEASALSVTVDVTYVSDYVFRGVKLADASIQPSVEAAYGDFYAGAWHSSELSNNNGGTETDLYAGYGFAVTDIISLDVGGTAYTYSGGSSDDTLEAFVGASFDVLLSPTLYYYYDFDNDESVVEASIGYSIPLDAIKASLDLSAKYGWVAPDAGEQRVYGVVGAAVPFKLSETATFTVGVDYIINDGGDFIDGDEDGIVGKAGVSIGF
jgi:uncharacterized protein (TIGR02001 family)